MKNLFLKAALLSFFLLNTNVVLASNDTSDADARRFGCIDRFEAARSLTSLLMKRSKTDFIYDVNDALPWLRKNYPALMAKAQPLTPRQTPSYDPTMNRGFRVFGREVAAVAEKVAFDFSRQMHFVPGHVYGSVWIVLWPYDTDYSGYGENAEIFVSCRGKRMVQPVYDTDYKEIGAGFN